VSTEQTAEQIAEQTDVGSERARNLVLYRSAYTVKVKNTIYPLWS